MEQKVIRTVNESRKRKAPDSFYKSSIHLDEFNQDLLEKILSWLPTSSYIRLRSVCKRWNSVANSATFKMLCSQVPSRDPCFFMVDEKMDEYVIYDTYNDKWRTLNPKFSDIVFQSILIASSGGLVCFRTVLGDFLVCNPITGTCRQLPSVGSRSQSLQAVAMSSSSRGPGSSYKLVLVSGEFPNLTVKIYNSAKDIWENEFPLSWKTGNLHESDASSDETMYFLSKTGDVVTTNMQKSPSKQYSSVIIEENGEEVMYFLSYSGSVIACNLNCRSFTEYPKLLPAFFEYSIDLIEYGGKILAIVLSELMESASLRLWMFSEAQQSWQQIAMMPPSMSNDFYGKKADINCAGCGDLIFICVNLGDSSTYVLCNLSENEWVELPKTCVNGLAKNFMSAFPFEPRIEARI